MTKIIAKVSPIKKLHVTEKSSILSEANAFAFEVIKDSTKNQITKEIIKLYKVTPIKVNIVNSKGKRIVSKGKVGKTAGVKKAYVFLKKGDTINLA